VLKQVHGYALQRIILEQAKLPARGPPPGNAYPAYDCSIEHSHGLPCYYKIWQRKITTRVIQLEDIHPHWYFSRPERGTSPDVVTLCPLPILNPLPIQGRGRPRGALGGVSRVAPTNTRRLPCAFEEGVPLLGQHGLPLVDL
jgi:hypothetical protein